MPAEKGPGGADWSVELFMDMETVTEIIRICLEELTGPKRQEDPAEKLGSPNTAYAATVDLTDASVMFALTINKDSVELSMSARDEHKAVFGKPISSRWDMKGDSVELHLSVLTEDKLPLYLVAITKVLKYLKKTGQLDRLKELDDRSAGAVITAKKGSRTISAQIVQGRQRPELLCLTGFLGMDGEQMCRPYADETPDFRT